MAGSQEDKATPPKDEAADIAAELMALFSRDEEKTRELLRHGRRFRPWN